MDITSLSCIYPTLAPSLLPFSSYLQPTLIADCTHSMSVMREENFGPILAVAPVEDDQDALRWLNGTRFGLTASIWTSSVERVKALAPRITSGMFNCSYVTHVARSGFLALLD